MFGYCLDPHIGEHGGQHKVREENRGRRGVVWVLVQMLRDGKVANDVKFDG